MWGCQPDLFRTEVVAFIRKQGKIPTSEARTEIAKKRSTLQLQLDQFHEQAFHLFPSLESYDIDFGEIPYGDDIISDAEDDDPWTVPDVPRGNVEKLELPLPSTFSGKIPHELMAAAEMERKLRIAQAEEALEGIRHEICHKSYIYRSNVKLVSNKKGKQRGYAALHVADRALRHYIRVYKQARWSLQQLGSTSPDLDRFRELTNPDLQPLKSIYLPNERGQSTIAIPWIWKLHVAEGSESEYLGECNGSVAPHSLVHFGSLFYSIPDQLVARSCQEVKMGRGNCFDSAGNGMDCLVLPVQIERVERIC
jgi:hypothetical protein